MGTGAQVPSDIHPAVRKQDSGALDLREPHPNSNDVAIAIWLFPQEKTLHVRRLCIAVCSRDRRFVPTEALRQLSPPLEATRKPAEIAGFRVKSLVALPGIEPGF